jgi:cytochrome c peroxidase
MLCNGFTSLKDGPRLDNAILFENQTDMADATADWFERTVFPFAVPYDQWLREQQTKFGDIVLSKRKKADK